VGRGQRDCGVGARSDPEVGAGRVRPGALSRSPARCRPRWTVSAPRFRRGVQLAGHLVQLAGWPASRRRPGSAGRPVMPADAGGDLDAPGAVGQVLGDERVGGQGDGLGHDPGEQFPAACPVLIGGGAVKVRSPPSAAARTRTSGWAAQFRRATAARSGWGSVGLVRGPSPRWARADPGSAAVEARHPGYGRRPTVAADPGA
jgi:hypothetical protein